MPRDSQTQSRQLALWKRPVSGLALVAATLAVPVLSLLILNPWNMVPLRGSGETAQAPDTPAVGMFAFDLPLAQADNRSASERPAAANRQSRSAR